MQTHFQVRVGQPGSSKATGLHMLSFQGCPAKRRLVYSLGQAIPSGLWVSSMCEMDVTRLKASLGAVSHDLIYHCLCTCGEVLPPGAEG